MPQTLYEQDFYAWSNQQSKLFKEKKFEQLDWENLSEEIEDMGASQKRELENRLIQLLMHLLKWKYQPIRRGNSWRRSIIHQRFKLYLLIKNNPSLKHKFDEIFNECFVPSVRLASLETDIPQNVFPEICEWTTEQILNDEFFPN